MERATTEYTEGERVKCEIRKGCCSYLICYSIAIFPCFFLGVCSYCAGGGLDGFRVKMAYSIQPQ